MKPTDFVVRSQRQELGVSSQPTWVDLLSCRSPEEAWRIVEAFSEKGHPFELEARWSAGEATGAWVRVTVAHATRLCVFTNQLTLRATNLFGEKHAVAVTVADGFAQTANVWEHRDHCDGTAVVSVSIPPFARFYQLDLAERLAVPLSEVTLFDGAGTARARHSAATQPIGGIPVGSATRLEVLTQQPTDLRGIFHLLM